MQNIHIEKIALKELNQLQQIGKQTFYETFSSDNTEEDMQNYLATSFSTAKLLDELNDEQVEFYFAKKDKRVIGYLKLNYGDSQTELKDHKALEIERIYVLKAYHGKNVGQKLFEKAMEVARAKKVEYVWLGVWEHNLRAIRFYEKNGFEMFDKHIFKLGKDEQMDVMMRLKVK